MLITGPAYSGGFFRGAWVWIPWVPKAVSSSLEEPSPGLAGQVEKRVGIPGDSLGLSGRAAGNRLSLYVCVCLVSKALGPSQGCENNGRSALPQAAWPPCLPFPLFTQFCCCCSTHLQQPATHLPAMHWGCCLKSCQSLGGSLALEPADFKPP